MVHLQRFLVLIYIYILNIFKSCLSVYPLQPRLIFSSSLLMISQRQAGSDCDILRHSSNRASTFWCRAGECLSFRQPGFTVTGWDPSTLLCLFGKYPETPRDIYFDMIEKNRECPSPAYSIGMIMCSGQIEGETIYWTRKLHLANKTAFKRPNNFFTSLLLAQLETAADVLKTVPIWIHCFMLVCPKIPAKCVDYCSFLIRWPSFW